MVKKLGGKDKVGYVDFMDLEKAYKKVRRRKLFWVPYIMERGEGEIIERYQDFL